MLEGKQRSYMPEQIESLKTILELEQNREYSIEEVIEIADTLITFYELLGSSEAANVF